MKIGDLVRLIDEGGLFEPYTGVIVNIDEMTFVTVLWNDGKKDYHHMWKLEEI